jgi:hypothetical protein
LGRGCGGRSSWRRIGDGSARIVVAAVVELPAAIADIAYHNKAVIYDILFKAAAETLTTIGADPKHLDARIGFTAVLHSWVRRLRITRSPHHRAGRWHLARWATAGLMPARFLPLRPRALAALSRLFLEPLATDYATGRLRFFGDHARLAERRASYLKPLRKAEWLVDSKRPFDGPEAVVAYLSLYTHRIAISTAGLSHSTTPA